MGRVGWTTSASVLWWMLVLVERSSDPPKKLGKSTILIWNVNITSPHLPLLQGTFPSVRQQPGYLLWDSLISLCLGQLQTQVEASSSIQPPVRRANTISHWVHQSYFLSSFSYFSSFFLSLLSHIHVVVYHVIPFSALSVEVSTVLGEHSSSLHSLLLR